ncbi:MAG: Do family serine endopeptidase [Cytophagaceae bacterium]|nr:Do family serine endopeptidase [Cytophagaceae bacterium]MBK9935710.1 Do family serine endopeptidase [Cytophagaceae bacterium]MBL0302151.1 Do family serine endopeptidase [Cytophagaceae bacterium]MBL0324971.1 Do family serine endopeptidase [Cytophagaceae bacterium]
MNLSNSWKTALIAVAASVATIAGYKAIDGYRNDVIINEAGSGRNGSLVNFANMPAGQPGDFTYAAGASAPAVVHIKAKSTRTVRQMPSIFDQFFGMDEDFFGGPRTQNQESSGSGVIISEDGYIVTNNHVVDGSSELEVITYNKKSYEATVVGTDPSTDIAVIKIEEKRLPTITFGNSDEVKIGEWVLAVGNPFNLESTVTAGIISAIGRNINILGQNQRGQNSDKKSDSPIESFIQTDAAVNPGNSGGALVNLNGHLIGINTAIASPNGAYAGYAFAVPSSIVKKVSTDLIKFGNVQRGFVGIGPVELNNKNAKEFDVDIDEGIYVAEVTEEGAAKKAGIKKGDVITKVDGIDTKSEPKFRELIGRKRPGEKVVLTINRDGAVKDYSVTLKNNQGGEGLVKKDPELSTAFGKMGIKLEELSSKDKDKLGTKYGVRVAEVDPDGLLAQNANIEEGFIITRVGNVRVSSAKEVRDLINQAQKNGDEGVLICGIYEDRPNRTSCIGIPLE